jgi:hypothetical protein
MTIEGGTDGDVFVAFLETVLAPILQPGDLVVMDNAGAHEDPRVAQVLAQHGAKPVYLAALFAAVQPHRTGQEGQESFEDTGAVRRGRAAHTRRGQKRPRVS